MNGAAPSSAPRRRASCGLWSGEALAPDRFGAIRRRMILDFCKWDPQVGDVSTLAPFPLVLGSSDWQEMAGTAEALARETMDLERALLGRPELFAELGLPRALCRVLEDAGREGATPSACRVIRFDFHPTSEGWKISEANTDVPGGYAEASAFAALMADAAPGAVPVGDPGARFADALARVAGEGTGAEVSVVALMVAPGFMEDQQVVAGLASRLRDRDVRSILIEPAHLRWSDATAHVRTTAYQGPVGAMVRFYQGEWLSTLPKTVEWRRLFAGGATPVANPGVAILSESKRLPLVWDRVGVACPAWRRALPETRDPRDVAWADDEGWLLKSAFSNTGDSVILRELVSPRTWRARKTEARIFPRSWLAQRRFETTSIDTPVGRMFPCIGVHTIDGRACGIYGRLSPKPVIDYAAVDVAVLVDDSEQVA